MRFSIRWLILTALLLPACGKETSTATAPANSGSATSGAPAALSGPRIVSTVPAATLNLVLIGGDKHLVGVSSFDKMILPEGEQNLPVVGNYEQTNYEQLVKLAPTVLIIQQRDVAPRMQEFVADHHIELLNMKFESVDDIWTSVRVLAKAADCQAAAEKAIAKAQQELKDVAADYKDADHPRVLYLMEPSSNLACGTDTFVEQMINLAGGTLAPVGKGFATVTRETMVKLAPDVLLIGAPDGQAEVASDPRLAPWLSLPVPATRNKRVFLLTNLDSQIPSLNVGKSVRDMAELIHRNAPAPLPSAAPGPTSAPAATGRGP